MDLFGLSLEGLLKMFDIIKYNIPAWTYNKLFTLHNNWINWFKSVGNVESLNENKSILILENNLDDESKKTKKEFKGISGWLFGIEGIKVLVIVMLGLLVLSLILTFLVTLLYWNLTTEFLNLMKKIIKI